MAAWIICLICALWKSSVTRILQKINHWQSILFQRNCHTCKSNQFCLSKIVNETAILELYENKSHNNPRQISMNCFPNVVVLKLLVIMHICMHFTLHEQKNNTWLINDNRLIANNRSHNLFLANFDHDLSCKVLVVLWLIKHKPGTQERRPYLCRR